MTNVNKIIQSIENIAGVIALDDHDAENISAGRFGVSLNGGSEREFSGPTNISLEGTVGSIGIRNLDSDRSDEFADGHDFFVSYRNRAGDSVRSELVGYGSGVSQLDQAKRDGAVSVRIVQYVDREVVAGEP